MDLGMSPSQLEGLGLLAPTGIPPPPPDVLRNLAERCLNMGLDASGDGEPREFAPMHPSSVIGDTDSETGGERSRTLVDEGALIQAAVERAMASVKGQMDSLVEKVGALSRTVEDLTRQAKEDGDQLAKLRAQAEDDAEEIASLRRKVERETKARPPAVTPSETVSRADKAFADRLEGLIRDGYRVARDLDERARPASPSPPPRQKPATPAQPPPQWEEEEEESEVAPYRSAGPTQEWEESDEVEEPWFPTPRSHTPPSPPRLYEEAVEDDEVEPAAPEWEEANEDDDIITQGVALRPGVNYAYQEWEEADDE